MALCIFPCTLSQANDLVKRWHRHHKPVVGHRFSIGVMDFISGDVHGVAIVGRPVARNIDQNKIAEVTRLVTDGTKNICSILYAAAARIAKNTGFIKIQTYILNEEPGTSLIAAGWNFEINTHGGSWVSEKRINRREDQPMTPKKRFGKILNKDFPESDFEKIKNLERLDI